jgi:hypothetical protein
MTTVTFRGGTMTIGDGLDHHTNIEVTGEIPCLTMISRPIKEAVKAIIEEITKRLKIAMQS